MEYMIWFLRIFSLFFLGIGIALFSRNEISFTQSTKTNLKFEQTLRLLLQNYSVNPLRLPTVGDSYEGKFQGEDIKLELKELIPNAKAVIFISGFSHFLKETQQIDFLEKENFVQIESKFHLETKTDLLSRVVFLFFGQNFLKSQAETIQKLMLPPI